MTMISLADYIFVPPSSFQQWFINHLKYVIGITKFALLVEKYQREIRQL